MQLILTMTNSNPVVITTDRAHGYVAGLIVKIVIPSTSRTAPFRPPFIPLGMPEMDGQVGQITILSPTSFSLPVDSTKFTPYAISLPPADSPFVGQVIPIAQQANIPVQNIATSNEINNNIIPPEIYPPPIVATYR
jgi:hypothetical protein